MTEICIRQQRGKPRPPLCLTRSNKPTNLLPRRYPQRPETGVRLSRIVREGEDRNASRSGRRGNGCSFGGRQGAENYTIAM
jgi:hypothetical protein